MKLLKGYEGVEFYSPCYGNVKLEVVHTPEVEDTRYYILIRPKSYRVGREMLYSNGKQNEEGCTMIFPTRSLYEKYPLDAYTAWKKWQECKKDAKSIQVINSHEYVDLGLPSGLKWATCNVGASNPSDYGDYFAWREVRSKLHYDWNNCFDSLDSEGDSWGTYKIGGRTWIVPSSGHDAARENWGGTWRIPTDAEIDELGKKCEWTWMSIDGHVGYKITGPNGNSIFLPAAGCRRVRISGGVGETGSYWSSTLSSSSDSARGLYFNSGGHDTYDYFRYYGRSVRPVLRIKK